MKPKFMKLVEIPERQNKQDFAPPHAQFEVMIYNTADKLSIVAQNPTDRQDFFEINVDGVADVEAVLKKFNYNYIQIVDQLRLMNDVMVLLNPKVTNKTADQAPQREVDSQEHRANEGSQEVK